MKNEKIKKALLLQAFLLVVVEMEGTKLWVLYRFLYAKTAKNGLKNAVFV